MNFQTSLIKDGTPNPFDNCILEIKYIKIPKYSEYLEHIIDNKFYFSVNYIFSKYKFDKSIRMTLDYKEDLLFFKKIFKQFYIKHPNFSISEVLKYLNLNKKIIKINNHKKVKLKKFQIIKELELDL